MAWANMEGRFIAAYTWMYGSTKKQAKSTFHRAMEIADYGYVKEIIDCFENNAKKSAYTD